MNIKYYFNLAKKIAMKPTKIRRAYCMGAIGIRKDGVVVGSGNGYADNVTYNCHAEKRVVRKTGGNSTIFVIRVKRKDKSLAMAKPCAKCLATLKAYKVNKIYYSINNNEYGTITLKK